MAKVGASGEGRGFSASGRESFFFVNRILSIQSEIFHREKLRESVLFGNFRKLDR